MSGSGHVAFRFGRFVLSPSKHTLYLESSEIALSPKSFQVLLYLVRNPGRLVTKDELLVGIWPDSYVEEANLAQQIHRLRKAFEEDPAAKNYIRTAPGIGYQFTAEVTEDSRGVLQSAEPLQSIAAGEDDGLAAESAVAQSRSAVPEPEKSTRPFALRFATLVALLFIALVGSAWVIWKSNRQARNHHEIVVADFDNQTGEPVFKSVLKTALTIDLQQSPELTVLRSGDAAATLRRMLRSTDEPFTETVALEVCRRNNDKAVISGTITRLEQSYLITLEATDCQTGRQFSSVKAQADKKDSIIESLGRIDAIMRRRLGESLGSIKNFDVPLASSTTTSLDALIAYSEGTHQGFSAAIPYYERALQLDPKFAMAWENLGVANGEIGNLSVQRDAFIRAYQLRQVATAREQFWITSRYNEIVMNDLDGTRKNYELFVRSYPADDVAWDTLADTLRQMGRNTESLQAAKRGIALAPHGVFAQLELSKAYMATGQLEMARAICRDGLQVRPDDAAMHQILQVDDYALKDQAEYDQQMAWSHDQDREFQSTTEDAQALATSGRMNDARRAFQQARDVALRHGIKDFPHIDDAEEALFDSLLGDESGARRLAAHVPDDMLDVSVEAGLGAALSGNDAVTNRLIDNMTASTTQASSLTRQYFIPILRAALALRAGDGVRSVALIQPARNYAMREYWVSYLLGQAYLEIHQPAEAATHFQIILSNPGIDPISPMYPLAHLGLARAYYMQRRVLESRKEYESFLALWQNGDPDMPALREARFEYAHLRLNNR